MIRKRIFYLTVPTGMPLLDAAPASTHRHRLIRLAFLAPDIQRAILAGEQPPGLTLASLMEGPIPPLWPDQRRMVGITRRRD